MSELRSRLDKLVLRLDYMGMRVEQALADAIRAAREGSISGGQAVVKGDSVIDREEVEIEQECIRLLALYQPAAVDLRKICTIIKANSDLERIADLASNIGRGVHSFVDDGIDWAQFPELEQLAELTTEVVGRTVRLIPTADVSTAEHIIQGDAEIDVCYGRLVRTVVEEGDGRLRGPEAVVLMVNLAKAFERIGDLCTNIAEDVIFLRTGDIVRHTGVYGPHRG